MPRSDQFLAVFASLIGEEKAKSIQQGFSYVELAEARVAFGMERHPNEWVQWGQKMEGLVKEKTFQNGPIWDAFYFLNPSPYIPKDDRPNFLIRHFDELLDRVAWFEENVIYTPQNRDKLLLKQLAPATDPEIIMGFSKASLEAPFNRLGANCYTAVFKRIFPEEAASLFDQEWAEDWPGQVDQTIWSLKKRYSQQRATPRILRLESENGQEPNKPTQMKLL